MSTLDTKELKTITLLYVEDDEMVRTQTLKLFNKIFKKVFVANDGEEGLKIFLENQNEIEIVVSDINMPNMNGMEMIKAIKDSPAKNVPFIFTTAHNDSTNLQGAIDLNIDKYLSKPLQMKDLTVSIVELVVKYRKQYALENLAKNLVQTTTKDSQLKQDLELKVNEQEQKIKHYEVLIDNFILTLHIDKVGIITEVSNKFNSFFGFAKDEIINSNISTLKFSLMDRIEKINDLIQSHTQSRKPESMIKNNLYSLATIIVISIAIVIYSKIFFPVVENKKELEVQKNQKTLEEEKYWEERRKQIELAHKLNAKDYNDTNKK
jgi:CheY-like chemotaxis protein